MDFALPKPETVQRPCLNMLFNKTFNMQSKVKFYTIKKNKRYNVKCLSKYFQKQSSRDVL